MNVFGMNKRRYWDSVKYNVLSKVMGPVGWREQKELHQPASQWRTLNYIVLRPKKWITQTFKKKNLREEMTKEEMIFRCLIILPSWRTRALIWPRWDTREEPSSAGWWLPADSIAKLTIGCQWRLNCFSSHRSGSWMSRVRYFEKQESFCWMDMKGSQNITDYLRLRISTLH